MRLRTLIAVCAAVASIICAIVATQASASIGECPEGWLCLWQNELFTGRMLEFHDSGSWQNLTEYGFNDQASSVYNHTNKDAKLAWDINGGEPHRCLQPGESLGVMPGNWDNNVSSIRIFTTSTVC